MIDDDQRKMGALQLTVLIWFAVSTTPLILVHLLYTTLHSVYTTLIPLSTLCTVSQFITFNTSAEYVAAPVFASCPDQEYTLLTGYDRTLTIAEYAFLQGEGGGKKRI